MNSGTDARLLARLRIPWCCALAFTLTTLLTWTLSAAAADPFRVIRAFCRADGEGARLHPRTWQDISQLIAWQLEPAWDRVVLIAGYEIAPLRPSANGMTVDVVYSVVADVRPGRLLPAERVETRTYQLGRESGTGLWKIAGPPYPPAVFESPVDGQAMAQSLDPQSGTFLSNSVFIWHMLSRAGWTLPYLDTQDLAAASLLSETTHADIGDLVFYLANGEPYHVGFLVAEATIVSATLNAGIWRSPVDAFVGETRVLHLVGNRTTKPYGDRLEVTETPVSSTPSQNTPSSVDTPLDDAR